MPFVSVEIQLLDVLQGGDDQAAIRDLDYCMDQPHS
jgi:hypothetical protein